MVARIRVYCSRDLVNWSHETDILTNQVVLLVTQQIAAFGHRKSVTQTDNTIVSIQMSATRHVPSKTVETISSRPTIHGPWSEPIYLNGSGFDPSLFHDQEACIWLLNALWIIVRIHQINRWGSCSKNTLKYKAD